MNFQFRFAVLVPMALLWISCHQSDLTKGEALAKTHCSSCHQFPEPTLLDKSTWTTSVLPRMALFSGMDYSSIAEVDPQELDAVVSALPKNPLMSQEDWNLIVQYYSVKSPKNLDSLLVKGSELKQFSVQTTSGVFSRDPRISMISSEKSAEFWVSNRTPSLIKMSTDFKPLGSIPVSSPVSSLHTQGESVYYLEMGKMDPNDLPLGKLYKKTGSQAPELLIDSLKRPVHFQLTDLNGDNINDFIISCFGNYTGELAVFEGLKDGGFQKHLLAGLPGCRKTITRDMDADGLPEIYALFTQGDEHLARFRNLGAFQFRKNILLRFPPVYGSAYFDLKDFNRDGREDILYANGDNADYSKTLKPYHGIWIYLAESNGTYKEDFFFPMNGATQAEASDFDLDGDLDIAAISFFPNWKSNAEAGFVYLENRKGDFKFKPFVTKEAALGRWMVMELSDFDSDGDEDILLGALNFNNEVPSSNLQNWQSKSVEFILLSNRINP